MASEMTNQELNLWIARHLMAFPELTATWVEYCNDLNACAQAEAKIVEMDLAEDYYGKIYKIYWDDFQKQYGGAHGWGRGRFLMFATASQRCRAMFQIGDKIAQARKEAQQ